METKVLIGIPTSEMARRADFYDYLNHMEKPMGTVMTSSHGQSPARNRNMIIRQALEIDATHILFIDDDVMVPQDFLIRMLAHDKDIVGGLYLMRNYPHFPIMFDEAFDDGKCLFSFLNKGRTGLIEVVNTGLGAVLIKTDVFRTMPEPWVTLGECEKDHWCDDIAFFNRARKLGFKMYIDLEARLGHVITAVITPHRTDDGTWVTVYNTSAANQFMVPQECPKPEDIQAEREKVLSASR